MKDKLNKIIEYSAYFYLFCLPFGKSIVEITSTIIIVSFFLKMIVDKRFTLPSTKVNIPIFVFVGTLLLSFINAPDFLHSGRAFISKYIKYILVFFAIYEVFDTKEKINNIIKVSVASILLVGIDGIFQIITKYDFLHIPPYRIFDATRVTACFPYPNDFSSWILIFILPILAVLLFGNLNSFKRTGIFFLLFFQGALFIATQTKSAFFGFFAAILFMIFAKKLYRIFIILVLIGILFMGAIIVKPDLLPERFRSLHSMEARLVWWQDSIEIYKRHPIIGNGINTYFTNFKEARSDEYKGKKGSYAHNCFLQMATEIGIIGLMAFLWFLGAFFVTGLKSLKTSNGSAYYKAITLGLLSGVLAFLIHAFFDTNLYSLNLVALFWFSLAIGLSLARIVKE